MSGERGDLDEKTKRTGEVWLGEGSGSVLEKLEVEAIMM